MSNHIRDSRLSVGLFSLGGMSINQCISRFSDVIGSLQDVRRRLAAEKEGPKHLALTRLEIHCCRLNAIQCLKAAFDHCASDRHAGHAATCNPITRLREVGTYPRSWRMTLMKSSVMVAERG